MHASAQRHLPLTLCLAPAQDCFGGCTDPNQGFHGVLDEVRLWKVVRPQSDILRTMRLVEGLEGHPDLVAWWRFNEPGAANLFVCGWWCGSPLGATCGAQTEDGALDSPAVRADEDQGMFRYHRLALDSSGKGNHLPLDTPPTAKPALITLPQPPPQTPPVLSTWSLELRNNFAMSRAVRVARPCAAHGVADGRVFCEGRALKRTARRGRRSSAL